MRTASLALLVLLVLPGQAAGADDSFKVIKLEQDVRNLERQVQALMREVDQLKQQLSRAGDRRITPRSAAEPASGSSDWLEVSRWDRVRAGMSELEVIGVLGPPTSMRQEGDQRVLLYAMEIGAANFLSGSVTLQARAVVEVSKPVLR
jgi:hypothetical protein